jgi:sugar phosphate isomerase/epimerase
MTGLDRLSLNQITVDQLGLPAAVALAAEARIPWIGIWRHKLAGRRADDAARIVRESGLRVSSLCRGGFFVAASEAERRRRDGDNRQALEEAAALGCDVLVLVCGATPPRELASARRQVGSSGSRLTRSTSGCVSGSSRFTRC